MPQAPTVSDWRTDLMSLVVTHSPDVMSGQRASEVLKPVLDLAVDRFSSCLAHAWSVDPRREQLVLIAQHSREPVEDITVGVIRAADSLSGKAFVTRQIQIHYKPPEITTQRFWSLPVARRLNIQSFISLPVWNISNPHQITLILNLYFDFVLPSSLLSALFRAEFRRYTGLLATNLESNLRERAFRMSARVSQALARVTRLTSETGSGAFARCVREAIGVDWVTVYLENWNQTGLLHQADDSRPGIPIPTESEIPLETMNVWRTNRELLSPQTDLEFPAIQFVAAEGVQIASAILVPLHDVRGRCKGVVRCMNLLTNKSSTWRRALSYDEIAVVESMERAFAPPLDMLLESQARDVSLRNLAHELRVPVVALRAVLERMEHEYVEATGWFSFRFPYFTEANTFTNVMQRLLAKLEITRQGPDRVLMLKQRTRLLSEVIQPAIRFMQPILKMHGMTSRQISHYGFDAVPPIDVDRGLLTQVVFNLLENSVKYFPKNRPRSDFAGTVVCNTFSGSIEIVFGDNGAGIPETDRERIFYFGFRGDGAESSNVQGTGIGCWLAKEIAKRHDGELEVRSCLPLELVLTLPHSRSRKVNFGAPSVSEL